MLKIAPSAAIIALTLLSHSAMADPIKLKLSFFSSDRSTTYQSGVKPFVDAVNAELKGQFEIEVHAGGSLGKDPAQQPKLVADGVADFAYVIPAYSPDRFIENEVTELPGLYRDMREATLVYMRLIAANVFKGYEDFVVIGAYMTDPEIIHTRPAIASLRNLKGMRIRANNATEAATLEKLGMVPVMMPVTRISDALSSGELDGTAVPLPPLQEFGVGRIATHHYFLNVGAISQALVMNRKKFESLPPPIQDVLRKYGGAWLAEQFLKIREEQANAVMQQISASPGRKIIFPSQQDLNTAEEVFESIVKTWAAKLPRNQEILKIVKAELEAVRNNR